MHHESGKIRLVTQRGKEGIDMPARESYRDGQPKLLCLGLAWWLLSPSGGTRLDVRQNGVFSQ